MKALAFVIALLCAPARADEMVLRQGENRIHLADSPCVHAGTLGQLQPELRPKFRKAWAVINGKYWYACWLVEPERKTVYILFEDGDESRLDQSQFKRSPGV